MMIGPLPEDKAQEQRMIKGSQMLLEAITYYHVRRAQGLPPAPYRHGKFRWHHNPTSTADPQSGNSLNRPAVLQRLERKQADAELHRTDRDPCFRCGTRGDHGCNHTRRGA